MTIKERTRTDRHGRPHKDMCVYCDAEGCAREQSVPADDDLDWRASFMRQIGWRTEPEGKHSCPFCAGGENLERLRAVFEGRGKDNVS